MTTTAENEYQLRLDFAYGIRLHQLHGRFFGRVRIGLGMVSLLAGSAAFTSAVAGNAGLLAVAGLASAGATFFDLLAGLAKRQADHQRHERDLAALDARSRGMDVVDADRARRELGAEAPELLDTLRELAWDDTLRQFGHEDERKPLTALQKIFRAFV